MFKIVAVIFLLTCSTKGIAQTETQLRAYHSSIYQAEQHIIAQEYTAAAEQYEAAAKAGISMFAVDACNAATCAAYIKDYMGASFYAKKLMLKGAELSFFASRSEFNDLLKSAEWKALKAEYPALKAEREKRINKDLVKRVKWLVDRDQYMHKWYRYSEYDSTVTVKMNVVDDSIVKVLTRLLRDNNYLNEDLLGVQFADGWPVTEPEWGIIMLHYYQRCSQFPERKGDDPMDGLLKAAVKSGNIKPETAMNWLEHGAGKFGLYGGFVIVSDTLWEHIPFDTAYVKYPFHSHNFHYDTCAVTKRIIADYYLESPANIKRKVVYCYRRHLQMQREKEVYPNFWIRPQFVPEASFTSDEERAEFYKMMHAVAY